MTSEMTARAAKAAYEVCLARYPDSKMLPWDQMSESLRFDWIAYQEAALNAAKEPLSGMVLAGVCQVIAWADDTFQRGLVTYGQAAGLIHKVWPVMVAKALEGDALDTPEGWKAMLDLAEKMNLDA